MRFPKLSAALAALCLALPVTAQAQTFAFAGERAAANLAIFGESMVAFTSITHGQPLWQEKYDGMFDSLKGKTHRLGKDWWTTLLTSVDIEFGGSKIPAGSYCVGLNCDKDGKFSFWLLEAGKAMKANTHPFGPQEWKADHVVPLTLTQGKAEKSAEKMTMTFTADAKETGKGTFTLAWGKHTLTAAITMTPPAAKK